MNPYREAAARPVGVTVSRVGETVWFPGRGYGTVMSEDDHGVVVIEFESGETVFVCVK